MRSVSRRKFLRTTAASALAAMPGYAFTQMLAAPAAVLNDYRALVCVFMFGGNDAYNVVVPRSVLEYNVYAQSRQNLAIDQANLLPINPLTSDGTDYGLHPSMASLQTLFESGAAAFVNNVGPLIEPTTKSQFQLQSVALPPQLFSHNDQQDQWHSLRGNQTSNTGWAGRMADVLATGLGGQALPTNLSLFGSSLFQAASDTTAYVIGPAGPVEFVGFGDNGIFLEQRNAVEAILAAQYNTVYERAYRDVQQRAVTNIDLVTAALEMAPTFNTVFPASQLGTQLETVAKLIAVSDVLQMQRQVFFVGVGGFDTHDDQLLLQPGLLGGVADAMKAFYDATTELAVADKVTSFTQSDFARTLTSNGDGTDHAWGGIQWVVGDAVRGREMYGQYPDLALASDDDVGGGRMIPTTSSDQFAATLASWFGVGPAELSTIAPNLGNFSVGDLGFFL